MISITVETDDNSKVTNRGIQEIAELVCVLGIRERVCHRAQEIESLALDAIQRWENEGGACRD